MWAGSHVASGYADAPCPSAPLLQHKGWHPYVLRDMVLSGFAKLHSGLGSWRGLQALGGARPVGTVDSLASLVFSDWSISKHVSGPSFESDLYSQLGQGCSSISIQLGKLDD